MRRVLKAIGCVPDRAIDLACRDLYERGLWSCQEVTIRLFAVGECQVDGLPIPPEQQLTWLEVINFCVQRLKEYEREKSSVGQWTQDGRSLRSEALSGRPEEGIRRSFGLQSMRDPVGGT